VGEPVVVVSNRGPLSFSEDEDGNLVAKRGGGGLASSLAPLTRGTGATWVSAALSDADRKAAASGVIEAEGFRIRALTIDRDEYRMAYDVISNSTLWFLLHGMFDLPRRPRLDRRWRQAWDAYRNVNRAFANAAIEEAPEGATVLVQDYHLFLVGTWLAQERHDVRAVHFSHVPFCPADDLRVLPADVAEELLVGMSSHSSCGFHARRWADNFEGCCKQVLGWKPATFVSPLAPDRDEVTSLSHSDDCERELRQLDEEVAGRHLIARVDRVELSKNVLRGFLAFDELLETRPEWRERVVFAAQIYPSRLELAEYLAYRHEVETLSQRLNDRWATESWTPIMLDTSDNLPRSMAVLRRYDVLLVNPVRDGLNLVAMEGPLVNDRDGVLVLSREAGVCQGLEGRALEVNPFDISGTAEALAAALAMPPPERQAHAERLREASQARSPSDWLEEQLQSARRE
jgi:trehalose 6-phosphate synthase